MATGHGGAFWPPFEDTHTQLCACMMLIAHAWIWRATSCPSSAFTLPIHVVGGASLCPSRTFVEIRQFPLLSHLTQKIFLSFASIFRDSIIFIYIHNVKQCYLRYVAVLKWILFWRVQFLRRLMAMHCLFSTTGGALGNACLRNSITLSRRWIKLWIINKNTAPTLLMK